MRSGQIRYLPVIVLLLSCEPRTPNLSETYTTIGEGYSYSDSRLPSVDPPAGLAVEHVPMFVAFGFDDNGFSGLDGGASPGGLRAVLDMAGTRTNPAAKGNAHTFDGQPVHFSFYVDAEYIAYPKNESPVFVRRALHEAVRAGHEIGNHTLSHCHGTKFTLDRWCAEIEACTRWMIKPFDPEEDPENPDIRKGIGLESARLTGFRTPFLEYSDTVFAALRKLGFMYDCSIEEGWQEDQDGTDFFWPYTLDNASPGNAKTTDDGVTPRIGAHPGLWEMPCYVIIVPPDSLCGKYGVQEGFRGKMAQVRDYFDPANGKITGLDWNLWVDFQMSKAEFLAAMKYSFDLRLRGNRCPFLFGAHSDIYADAYPDTIANASAQERRDALREFMDYASVRPEVRIVSQKEILDWLRKPVAL